MVQGQLKLKDNAIRLVILISGNGSNLQAIIDAIELGHLNAKIVAVVSNRKKAYGLTRAEEAGIDCVYFPQKPYKDSGKSRPQYDTDLAKAIALYQPDLIVLAGWMHILSATFLDYFPDKVINLHPALPGQFNGTHSIERAYQSSRMGEIKESGIIVHYAIPAVDAGKVIIKAHVPILEEDSLNDFRTRMQRVEHRLIVQAIALIADEVSSQID